MPSVKNFPRFPEGDVEIRLITDVAPYVLHSTTLTSHSDFFQLAYSTRWNANDTKEDGEKAGVPRRRIYELRFDTAIDHKNFDALGFLVSKDDAKEGTEMLTVEGKAPTDIPYVFTFEEHVQIMRLGSAFAHFRFLEVLYHVVPRYSGDRCMVRWKMLKTYNVAKMYGAEELMQRSIDKYLLDHRAEVLEDCARRPAEMLCFANALRIDWVFKEAATVLIGLEGARFTSLSAAIQLDVPELTPWLTNKRAEFVAKLVQTDTALGQLQPADVTSMRSHQAIQYYGFWLRGRLARGQGAGLNAGYANLYHSIHYGLWVPEIMASLLGGLPVVQVDGAQAIAAELRIHIGEVFARTEALIPDLMKNCTLRGDGWTDHKSYMEMVHAPAQPLKFMKIEDHELPWAPQPPHAAAVAAATATCNPAQQN